MLQVTPKFILRNDCETFSRDRKDLVGMYHSSLGLLKFWFCTLQDKLRWDPGERLLWRMCQAFSTEVSFSLTSSPICSKEIYWGTSPRFWDKTIGLNSFLLNTSLTWRATTLICLEALWESLSFYGVVRMVLSILVLWSKALYTAAEPSTEWHRKSDSQWGQLIQITLFFLILKAPHKIDKLLPTSPNSL